MAKHYLAWWNLENLFSFQNDPTRTVKLQKQLGSELKGWTKAVLNKKLSQLASIIKKMNDGAGPDILGVCEVENENVLGKLTEKLTGLGRTYEIVHSDAQDKRGIDVAFIFDAAKYKTKDDEIFNHFILRRNATRDLLQVSFFIKPDNKRMVLIGNHWPSRSGGRFASEPYRIIAGETLAYFHQRIREEHGNDQPIIVMGDFNDAPFDRSLVDYALSERSESRVKSKRSKNPYLYNLMWGPLATGAGTHFFSGFGMLDQFLVNRPLLRSDSPFRVDKDSIEIVRFPETMTGSGKPRRYGRPSSKKTFNQEGFSDHFPIAIVVDDS